MSDDITEDVLKENSCKELLLTGVNVIPNDLHACHWKKNLDRDVAKFKCRKQKNSIIYKHQNLGNKFQEITNVIFFGRLFVSEGDVFTRINSLRLNADNFKVPGRFYLTP